MPQYLYQVAYTSESLAAQITASRPSHGVASLPIARVHALYRRVHSRRIRVRASGTRRQRVKPR